MPSDATVTELLSDADLVVLRAEKLSGRKSVVLDVSLGAHVVLDAISWGPVQ